MKRFSILLSLLTASSIYVEANPGRANYQTYCMACHGDKGQGGPNHSSPPLAKSRWVQGDPTRAIKVILNGLKGNLEVADHTYTALMMPPQGAVLSDQQIADTLSFVRTNWGNKSSKVKAATVAKVRKEVEGAAPFFEVDKLLEQHPLPPRKTPLRGLLMETYLGTWDKLPDFSTLKSEGLEEEHSNIISLRNVSHKKNFGLVWTGQLDIKKKGAHKFIIQGDDGIKLIINDKTIATINETGPMSRSAKGSYRFEPGLHDIRVEYFQKGGGRGISIRWEGPNAPKGEFLSDKVKDAAPLYKPIPLEAPGSEAFIYRNFIQGVSHRAIAVGYPGGKSIAFSQDDCSLAMIWKSGFLDGGLHWTGRGKGETAPMGEGVVNFVSGKAFGLEVNFLRMEHDEKRFPTFIYQAGDHLISDRPEPLENGIKRVIHIESKTNDTLTFRYHPTAANSLNITCEEVPDAPISEIPMVVKPGSNTFTIHYTYK